MRIGALFGLVSGLVLTVGMMTADASATSYVDDDGVCGGNTPCYTTIQAAINEAGGSVDQVG